MLLQTERWKMCCAIVLRKKAQGKGLASAATRKILQCAFVKIGLERVYLNVLSDNKKAVRLYERNGFVYEGEFRNHLYKEGEFRKLKWYSILKDEYEVKFGGGNSTDNLWESPFSWKDAA